MTELKTVKMHGKEIFSIMFATPQSQRMLHGEKGRGEEFFKRNAQTK